MKMPVGMGPEDFLQWYRNPVTQAFLGSLVEDRQEILEMWASKKFIGDNADQSNFLNAKALSQIDTIDQILGNLEDTARAAVEK